MRHRPRLLFGIGLVLLTGVWSAANATVEWTPEQIAEEFARSGAATQPQFVRPANWRNRHLDDPAYFLHYQILCDFLVSMQFNGGGQNNGGMIEGESSPDNGIIETDNTQEAIRIWSQYAVWTGDTATYGPNIRLAKGYCGRFPAWREGAGMYSIHNCGWGFEAEKIYRQAYQDTSWTWYADSCAWWVVAQPLVIDTIGTQLGDLDPLAEGLGIGGMYPHALYRGRTDWQNFALTKARMLRRWFERNPARLNANETWALCGGTALWGMCVSLFAQYPDSGVTWLQQYAPQLDVWQSTGTWNHSYNAWYCNAHYEVFNILQDSTYWNNAIFITDSLIGLDTDHDGGIMPGVGFPDTNDHSWVSAYMGWMGMERVINSTPSQDAAVIAVVSPNPDLPYLAGDSLIVAVRLANAGREQIAGRLRVTGNTYADSIDITMGTGVDTILTFSNRWIVPDDALLPDSSMLLAQFESNEDQVPENDSLTVACDIRHGVQITGSVVDALNPSIFVPAVVDIYHEGYPDSVWASFVTPDDGGYMSGPRPLLAGNNRIVVRPAVQYMEGEAQADIAWEDSPLEVNFSLTPANLALVDDDVYSNYETWYESSLDSFPGLSSRLWNRNDGPLADLSNIATVIWFCGDDSVQTLDTTDINTLTGYMNAGGHVLLIGQNITEDQNVSGFLHDVMSCSVLNPNTNIRRVSGMAGNPISDGIELFLIGSGGANNAWYSSSVSVLPGGTGIFRYSSGNEETCGVSGNYGAGKYIFLSFALEAASGLNNSTTRDQVLARCFSWFGDSTTMASTPVSVPTTLWLSQNYPNPFNPSTTIHFFAPVSDKPVSLIIYNVLGQAVRQLYYGPGLQKEMVVTWDGRTDAGDPSATGLYIYRLQTSEGELSRSLHLLR